MRRVCIAALFSAVAVGSQAPTSRLMRDKELSEIPDFVCVEAQLRSAAKDGRVQAITEEIPLGTNHRFVFDVGAVPHHLGILARQDRTALFRHVAWAPKLKLSELHSAEESLTRVELQLSGKCTLGDLTQGVERTCFGKNCDQLQVPPNTSLERTRGR